MFCWLGYAFALIALILCWIMGDMSVRAKLIWTGVYLALWLLLLVDGMFASVLQFVYALTLYFTIFGSQAGRRFRP